MSERPLQSRTQKLTQTFTGGINRDASFSHYNKSTYFETRNFKMYSNKEGSFFNLENIDGTVLRINLLNIVKILHIVETSDSIVLFLKVNYTPANFVIFRINKNKLKGGNSSFNIKKFVQDNEYYHSNVDINSRNYEVGLVFYCKFSSAKDIAVKEAIYNYETSKVEKIYWVDNSNFRHLNIVNSKYNDLENLTLEETLTYSKEINEPAEFKDFTSGSLKNGAYFYTYQLYNINGSETSFAPLSDVVYVTDRFSKSDYKLISGGKVGENSGRGVVGSVSNIDTSKFSRIRIVSVYYPSKNSNPQINIIEEKPVSNTLTFSDSGTSLGALSPEELIFRNVIINPGILGEKDNYLFVANVNKKDYFDVDEWIKENDSDNNGFFTDDDGNEFWESRAFSFGFRGGSSEVFSQTIYDEDGDNSIELYSSSTYSSGEYIKYNISGDSFPVYYNKTSYIKKTHDCIYDGIKDLKDTNCRAWQCSNSDTMNEVSFGLHPLSSSNNFRKYYGGIGYNISYKFKTHTINLNSDELDHSVLTNDIVSPETDANGFFNDYTNPNNNSKLAIPYDEVERYGIQFLENATGRVSYVKWIGDIRSPEPNSFISDGSGSGSGHDAIVRTWDSDAPTNAVKVLYLEFEVNNVPSGLSWRIVRVPKEAESDYSNKAVGPYAPIDIKPYEAGVITKSHSRYYYGYPHQDVLQLDGSDLPVGGLGPTANNTVKFSTPGAIISPDLFLDFSKMKSLEDDTDMFLRSFGLLTHYYGDDVTVHADSNDYKCRVFKYTNWLTLEKETASSIASNLTNETTGSLYSSKFIKCANPKDSYRDFIEDISDLSTPTTPIRYSHYIIYDYVGRNESYYYNTDVQDGEHDHSLAGSRLIVSPKDVLSTNFDGDYTAEIKALKKENYAIRYGGSSYEDKTFNIYNPVSKFISNNSSVNVYGDYYFGIFEHLNGVMDDETNSSVKRTSINWFPAISRKNFNFLSGDLFRKKVNKELYQSANLHENKGIYSRNTSVSVMQDEDFYAYNDAYEINRSLLDIALPKPFDLVEDNSALEVIHSNLKIPGEYTDSWIKFINNKRITLDSSKGDLINMIRFRDRLYYFQTKSFGTFYINERQTSINNQSSITIARGNVLEGYQVIDNNSGITDRNHVTVSDRGIYWIDYNRGEFRFYDGKVSTDIGDRLSIGSLIKDICVSDNKIKLYFDFTQNELYINVYNEEDSYFIIYNENYQKVTGMIDSGDIKFFSSDNKPLMYKSENNQGYVYSMNDGPKCYILGDHKNSSITLIVNPYGANNHIYEVFEALLTVINNDGTYYDGNTLDVIKSIEVSNSYQESVTINSPEDFTTIFRKIRTNLIYDSNNDKFKDYFTKVKVNFEKFGKKGSYIERILINEIVSYFTLQVL